MGRQQILLILAVVMSAALAAVVLLTKHAPGSRPAAGNPAPVDTGPSPATPAALPAPESSAVPRPAPGHGPGPAAAPPPMPAEPGPLGDAALDGLPAGFEVDIELLRRLFPQNRALPSATAEERAARRRARQARNRLGGRIAAGEATAEEIEAYYAEQAQLAADSIQILSFVLAEYGESMDARSRAKHEFLRAQFERRLSEIPRRRQQALDRLP